MTPITLESLLGGQEVVLTDHTASADERDEEEKARRKQERIDSCGQYRRRLDPLRRSWYTVSLHCGYFRECPKCMARRTIDFYNRYGTALQQAENQILAVDISRTLAKKVVRTLRSNDCAYWRIPTEDGAVILFEDCEIGLPEMPYLDPEKLDWSALANTPPRSRVTGSLGRAQAEEDDGSETILIEIPEVKIEVPEGVNVEDLVVRSEVFNQEMYHVPRFDVAEINEVAMCCADNLQWEVEQVGGTMTRIPIRKRLSFKTYTRIVESMEVDDGDAEDEELTVQQAMEELFAPF